MSDDDGDDDDDDDDNDNGFFLACEDFGRVFDHSPPALFVVVVVLKWRLARTH